MTREHVNAIVEQIAPLTGSARSDALVEWTRSAAWHWGLMHCDDEIGLLAREAYKALLVDAEADSPALRWSKSSVSTGRSSICRLLGIAEADAGYVSHPFRTMRHGGRAWIAGAIGCPSPFSGDVWPHLSIRDVVLWDPATGDTMIARDEQDAGPDIVEPDSIGGSVVVYADTGAFFRDWAARRALVLKKLRARANGEWAHPVTEPADGDLPGALIIGEPVKAPVRRIFASKLIAGPGLTRAELHAALVRSAGLPAVVEA